MDHHLICFGIFLEPGQVSFVIVNHLLTKVPKVPGLNPAGSTCPQRAPALEEPLSDLYCRTGLDHARCNAAISSGLKALGSPIIRCVWAEPALWLAEQHTLKAAAPHVVPGGQVIQRLHLQCA